MKILGEWGPFEAAYVHALLTCESLGVSSEVTFLIDSGASRTSILDRDADKLAIDFRTLRKFTLGITGIGGIVDSFILPDVTLAFRTPKGLHEEHLTQLFVLKHEVKEPQSIERIKKLPSLLGRDILNKYRFIMDRAYNLVVITDER